MSVSKFDSLAAWAVPHLPKRFQEGRLPYLFFVVWLLIGVMVVLALITPYPNGVPVPLADLLAPHFENDPDVMFSEDRYHPSAVGYALAAQQLLVALCQALPGHA